MSSVPNQPTILDCIELWDPSLCLNCHAFIDAVWVHEDIELPAEAAHLLPTELCPDCKRSAVPEERVTEWLSHYDRIRAALPDLGLDFFGSYSPVLPPSLQFRQRWRPAVCCLSVFGTDSRGRPMRTAGHPWIETYNVFGQLKNPCVATSAFPYFAPFPNDDPKSVFVMLGCDVFDPKYPGGNLELRWDPAAPHKPYRRSINGWLGLSSDQLGESVSRCTKALYEVTSIGGRPKGTTYIKREDYLEWLSSDIISNNGRYPKRDDFLRKHGIPAATYKRHKRNMNLGNWSALCDEASSSLRVIDTFLDLADR